MRKKVVAALLTTCMAAGLLAGCSSSSSTETTDASSAAQSSAEENESTTSDAYPAQEISGIIQWGAGGGTDTLMRPLAELASAELGCDIACENQTGNAGAVATEYVNDQEADGYTLLMGAENPELYSALDISDLTYDDFEPVFLIGDETVGIAVGKDSAYTTLTELIDTAVNVPGEIKMATTGEGGMPWEVAAFLKAVTGAEFEQVEYDSDASAEAAVVNGECDFTVVKVQTGLEDAKSGDLVYLSMLSNEKVEALGDVPLIIDEYPDFAGYLPWGTFYGIFVKKGTDQAVIDTLSDAFKTAYESDEYQKVLEEDNINKLGFTGDKAKEYMAAWQKNTITALYNSGAIDKTAEELGIEAE